MCLFPLLYLTITSDNVDGTVIPERVPKDIRPDESADPSTVANENKSDWKSTASATAKLLLRGVRDTADEIGRAHV